MTQPKYIHTPDVHNLQSPQEIVPILIAQFQPTSVLDVGCGIGNFLKVFKENGITDLLGVDGSWVKPELWLLSEAEFVSADLELPLRLQRQFDLVLCLEVAEHLRPEAAKTIIESLVSHGNTIIFSAAMPGQGGQGHLNEQPLSYWANFFARHDYQIQDILRNKIWNNTLVDYWYRQNIVCFTRSKANIGAGPSIVDIVHPTLLAKKNQELKNLKQDLQNVTKHYEAFLHGEMRIRTYLNILLGKVTKRFKSKGVS